MAKFLSEAQLMSEVRRCEFCAEKPCKDGCPANCSPADFIMAMKCADKIDYKRATSIIMGSNPLGGVCGAVCPEKHCMAKCVHKTFDQAINIPEVQATIIEKAKQLKYMPKFNVAKPNGKKVAIIGAGPAGLGAAAVLSQLGYEITFFEKEKIAGGMCNLIPDARLDKNVTATDIEFLKGLGTINFKFNAAILDPEKPLQEGFAAVLICTGLDAPMQLNIPGKEHILIWDNFLREPKKHSLQNKRVAIIGGGAVAVDCGFIAKENKAKSVDLICLENNPDMPITAHERKVLLDAEIGIVSKTSVTKISQAADGSFILEAAKINFPRGGTFKPEQIVPHSERTIKDYDVIIMAIGAKSSMPKVANSKVFYAGDIINGATTVVEAVASGKNIALEAHAALSNTKKPEIKKNVKSYATLAGRIDLPVSLTADFFGRPIISPFLLSAAPPSDGYENMKKAYKAGWAGGVMKTAFDNVPIHIPAEYMFVYNQDTYANCDNVSGHHLDRVCREIAMLVKEFPDRLTIGSTGGPVTGNDENDKKVWQANTRMLDQSGAMGVEYSLSCPQGGDGTEGDIVSQNARLTAKIIDWVMEASDPNIPKLFKLTGAVTSIYPIVDAIRNVFKKYPEKKAGITLANTFPTVAFRKGEKKTWEEGIVTGMSGDGVRNISYLTLVNVAPLGVTVSGNGGPMDYKAAADFLALGVKTVQFCTIALKYGVEVIDHLHSGLSYLMLDRGMKSVAELIGCALPKPITGFMELSPTKKVSSVIKELCEHCGNCTRCPYLAITLDAEKVPVIDPAKCIGCSLCTQKCFAKALLMRERTQAETAMLHEE
ncbi:MAG: FAD-dependent oxidoreductase [Gammaproteobacteria bacterium]|nr:FAD-dependent oxidoreductase [Gammaproteobacteria bacterium]